MRTFTSAQQQNLFLVLPDTWHSGDLDQAADQQAKSDIEQWVKKYTPDEAWDEQEVNGEVLEPFLGIGRQPEEKPAEGAPTHYYEIGIAFLRKVSVQRLRTKSAGARQYKDMRFYSPLAYRGHKVRDVYDKYFACGPRFYKPLLRYPELVEVRGSRPKPVAMPVVTTQSLSTDAGYRRTIDNLYAYYGPRDWDRLDPVEEIKRQRRIEFGGCLPRKLQTDEGWRAWKSESRKRKRTPD
jgi:hypothetical protein